MSDPMRMVAGLAQDVLAPPPLGEGAETANHSPMQRPLAPVTPFPTGRDTGAPMDRAPDLAGLEVCEEEEATITGRQLLLLVLAGIGGWWVIWQCAKLAWGLIHG